MALRTLVFWVVLGVLATVWSPFAPIRLFDFDAANFALALDDFQPSAHQPQPPGYPLYVGLTKIIHLFVRDVPQTFLLAGLLGAAAAVVLMWILGERMLGRQSGIFAALLLMTNPILWQTGMSDQVRIFIAVISIGVALAVFPGWEKPLTPRRFVTTAFVLGLLAGFRPEMLVSMGPLPLLVAVRSRMKLRYYFVSAAALLVGMAPWFVVLTARVGGIDAFVNMMQLYSAQQAGGSSLLFGAGWSEAWKMLAGGLWWVSLGMAAWIPAALFVRWRRIGPDPEHREYFLLIWFLSLFLFSVVVHIAASGHALGFIPVLCLAGGWVLSAVGETRDRKTMLFCVVLALFLNVLFFFKPYAKSVREASYKTVGVIGGINEITMRDIDKVVQQDSVFLVSDSEWVSWRILEYTFPQLPLIYLPGPLANPTAPPPVWLFQNRRRVRDLDPATDMMLPSCGTIIWLVSDDQSRQDLLAIDGADGERFFVATPARPGMHFRVGRYHLATSPQPCRKP